MVNRYRSIFVLITFLSLSTMAVSCRQHRTPKAISFRKVTKPDNTLPKEDRTRQKETSQDYINITDSIFGICTPALIADKPEQIIRRKAYILSYNKGTRLPNWVAWHLTSDHIDGAYKRLNAYMEDSSVPMPRATEADYHGSGWTRGHMCPAGDNKWDLEAMRESNILTNICPQHGHLNTGLWNRIEQDCRVWAKKYGDVFIVCGPILMNREHETIGSNRVIVPEAFFKVVLCLQGTPKAIGFVVRNNEGKKKRDQFINSVDEVERITGIDFFPSLPDDIEDKVESIANINEW